MNKKLTFPLIRTLAVAAVAAGLGIHSDTKIEAQGAITITSPAANAKLKAGLDYATDVLADPWDFNNREDVTLDPRQVDGFTNFTIANGLAGGTTTTASLSGSNSDTHFYALQRAYYNVVNTGRTGRRFPIDSGTYTKLAFKMSSTGAGQFPRVYWFHNDLGDPGGDAAGFLYTDPNVAAPTGNRVFVVDMTQVNQNGVNQGVPWTSGAVKGFGFYPNSSAINYNVQFDWVRLTTADSHPASANMTISWTGGSGTVNATVTDSGGTVYTVKTGLAGSGGSFTWNYGILPPGTYTLNVGTATRSFTVNSPPLIQVTDPDESGGDDFATDVLHNPWDMNDVNDVFKNVNIVNHLFNEGFAGGVYSGTSDGQTVAMAGTVPVGDPQVYLLSNQQTSNTTDIIDTTKYHRLTFDMTVDHAYDLALGSIMRVFWGSASSNTPRRHALQPDGDERHHHLARQEHLLHRPGATHVGAERRSRAVRQRHAVDGPGGAALPHRSVRIRPADHLPHGQRQAGGR